MQLLEDAIETHVGLTEGDSNYHISFIKEKLGLCAKYTERLSDISMKMARISIEVTRSTTSRVRAQQIKERSLKDSDRYKDLPRNQQTSWLLSQLVEDQRETDQWTMLKAVVSEVKEAVSERAQAIKRLDSDLRLHAKLLELDPAGKTGAGGATSPGSYTGSASGDVEIN